MNRNNLLHVAACAAVAVGMEIPLPAQTNSASFDTPQTRMRPIGSSNTADQSPAIERYRETAFQSSDISVAAGYEASSQNAFESQSSKTRFADPAVRQTVMLQQSGVVAPNLPGGMSYPGGNPSLPAAVGDSQTLAPPSLPPNLPSNPPIVSSGPNMNSGRGTSLPGNPLPSYPPSLSPSATGSSVLVPGAGDFTPLSQPQLDNGFATIGNCNCISAPSDYSAASGGDCGTPVSYTTTVPSGMAPYAAPQTYVPPPVAIAPPVVLPGAAPPVAAPATSSAVPHKPLFTLGQQRYPVEVGQGLWGQPVAYVPGQGCRNCVRYFFP